MYLIELPAWMFVPPRYERHNLLYTAESIKAVVAMVATTAAEVEYLSGKICIPGARHAEPVTKIMTDL